MIKDEEKTIQKILSILNGKDVFYTRAEKEIICFKALNRGV